MSLLAAKAPTAEEARFWNRSAADAVEAETVMDADLLFDEQFAKVSEEIAPAVPRNRRPRRWATCRTLVATAARLNPTRWESPEVLRRFWVYAHMGKVLVERAGDDRTANPYAAWV